MNSLLTHASRWRHLHLRACMLADTSALFIDDLAWPSKLVSNWQTCRLDHWHAHHVHEATTMAITLLHQIRGESRSKLLERNK